MWRGISKIDVLKRFLSYFLAVHISLLNFQGRFQYKIMREVIWQFYESHPSFAFDFVGDKLLPKSDVTISSVRVKTLETFLHEFVPYMEWLQNLRDFHESLESIGDGTRIPPDTYRSYDEAVQNIILPIFAELRNVENKIKEQENSMSLLKLARDIRPLFKTVKVLNDVHNNVVLNFTNHSPVKCATMLLARLHLGLMHSSSKLEQDLYLTLYLESLFKYFTVIDSWLSRDALEDFREEFPIADKLIGDQDWQMEFVLRELDDCARSDGVIEIICRQVLKIGRNIHLLRLLRKFHLVSELTAIYTETLHQEFIGRVLDEVSIYFHEGDGTKHFIAEPRAIPKSSSNFKFPATCLDECKYSTELDRLENLVDTTDGFLLKAFETFLVDEPQVVRKNEGITDRLFDKISWLTKNLFPAQHVMENVLLHILNERFSNSGLLVKEILIKDYKLKKEFEFLNHVFLFRDDLIFPLYRKMFEQLDSDGNWGNDVWLTSRLHDIIVDLYPEFYDKCAFEVKDSWKSCNDPLRACGLVSMNFEIKWPINVIISNKHMEMYKELFQLILKIKWALYTLHHLSFNDLEPRRHTGRLKEKALQVPFGRLKALRFGLVNIFISLQHYVLGYLFNKTAKKFDDEFEQAYDMDSIGNAHDNFVTSFYQNCTKLRDFNYESYGFHLLLYLVKKLRCMWRNYKKIGDQELEKCLKLYWECHQSVDSIINPVGLDDFVSTL